MRLLFAAFSVAIVAGIAVPVQAHHSFSAVYDGNKPVDATGKGLPNIGDVTNAIDLMEFMPYAQFAPDPDTKPQGSARRRRALDRPRFDGSRRAHVHAP